MSKNYKPKEFAELLNVSVLTLQRWDNAGKLKAFRTPTNRRFYTYEQYKEFMGITSSGKKVVIYTRVSTSNQKDDLKNQVIFLKQYANAKGIIVDEVIEDYGSGLDYNRKKWNKLIDECMTSVISILHVFSCRIYGLRKYKKEIKEDEEVEKSIQNRD
ncbi:IS607 family transposase [Clostridium sp. JN-9]|uniref:IS607 family transposase n=1 Tax=Clostridium sp. JN-9 TaxID=2507159 RepID=UPI000FFE1E5E|nr:IS607 family transposase [Clostridium sp. JN-9]QAT39694.1 IS607 family transposase [Clostridium sp. JN-9]